MTRPSDGELRTDTVLRNTYKIASVLGRGGMGSVYLAQHLRLPGKQVAVKVLRGGEHLTQEIFTRFRREAEIASRLGHPNIVEVLDYDTLEDGTPFLVLEFLRGESLQSRLERGRIPLDEVFSYTRQMGSALQAAHGAGIVHRDLKPANVFLVPTDSGGVVGQRVKLLDFGISKVLTSETFQTQEATLIGTPQYMSPEQAMGKNREIDARTDIFALGCIVYEMMSGKPVFGSGTLAQMIFRVVYEPAEPLGPLCPEAPASAVSAVHRALEKNPDDRFPDVTSFVEALTGSPLHTLSPPSGAQPLPRPVAKPPSGIAPPSYGAEKAPSGIALPSQDAEEGFDATVAPGSVRVAPDGTGRFGVASVANSASGTGHFGAPEAASGASGTGHFGVSAPTSGASGTGHFGVSTPTSGASGTGHFGVAPPRSGASGTGHFGVAGPISGSPSTGRTGMMQPEAPGPWNTGAPQMDPPALEPTLISKQVPAVPPRAPQPITAVTPPAEPAPQPVAVAATPQPVAAPAAPSVPSAKGRAPMIAAAVALFAAGGGVVWWLGNKGPPPPVPAPNPPATVQQPTTGTGNGTQAAQPPETGTQAIAQQPPETGTQAIAQQPPETGTQPQAVAANGTEPGTTTPPDKPTTRPVARPENVPDEVRQVLSDAESALKAGDLDEAIRLAKLSQRKKDGFIPSASFSILTRAYCQQKDLSRSKQEWPKVAATDRTKVRQLCEKNGIDF